MITVNRLTGSIQHMMTRPDCTANMLKDGCALAAAWNLSSVCVRPCDLDAADKLLKDSDTIVTGVIGFPHGSSDTAIKVAEAQKAIDDGAKELMMVLNIGWLISEKFENVEQDVKAIAMTAFRRSIPVHVIVGACFLNERLLKIACKIAENTGAAGVVTSSGYGISGAKVEDVIKMKGFSGDKLKVIANGGIKTLDQALELMDAGADRVCTVMTSAILDEASARRRAGSL